MLLLFRRNSKSDWNPNQITKAAWYDASDTATITFNSSTVAQINDKSGNSRHMSQAVAGNQPIYNASDSVANGKPSIYNAGNNAVCLSYASPFAVHQWYFVMYYGNGTQSVFSANYPSILGISQRVLGNANGNTWYGAWNTNTYPDGSESPVTAPLPMPQSVQLFDGNSANQAWIIGWSNSNRSWVGGWSEAIALATDADTATRQKIEGYLAWKWGIQSRLPSNHPYRYSKPKR